MHEKYAHDLCVKTDLSIFLQTQVALLNFNKYVSKLTCVKRCLWNKA